MQFGFQTILWGQNPVDYGRMLDVVADAGFEGVEFSQHPDVLPKLDDLLRLLWNRPRPLTLLGLAGGSLQSRRDYLNSEVDSKWRVAGWSPKQPYLYLDEWSPLVEELLADGLRLAVHPHYLKQISSAEDGFNRLQKNKQLLYIPDTAHSAIKRENILQGISLYHDRLAAVHLKDWRPGFGRASALYARGFTELGRGTVKPELVMDYLANHLKYKGWVVVEQDYTEGLAEASVHAAAVWLRTRGYHRSAPPTLIPRPLAERYLTGHGPITAQAVDRFLLQRLASETVGQLYQRIAEAVRECFGVAAVAIWSCSEMERILTLQGLAPSPNAETPELTVAFEQLGDTLDARLIPTGQAHPAIRRALRNATQGGTILRLPVKSTWNPHHTRIVLDLYSDTWKEAGKEDGAFLAQAVGRSFDTHLDRLAFSSAADLNLAATTSTDEQDFCKKLIELIRSRLQCEAVGLFMADRSGLRLKPFVSPELEWREDLHESEQYYEIGDGQKTTRIWQSREPDFQNRGLRCEEPAKPPKCVLRRLHADHDRVLATPIVDTDGVSMGLIRCANKLTASGNVCNFSDDDLVVLDYLLQQAIPTLRLMNAAKEEQQRLLIVAHELKRPAAALCTNADLMMAEVEDEKSRAFIAPRLQKKIVAANRWAENLRALVLRSQYLSGKPEKQFSITRQKTKLLGEIIAPTIAQLRWELLQRNLDPSALQYNYDEFVQTIPPLFVDRNMFQQIFFNLLDNAIKYAKDDPTVFDTRISSADDGEFYTIRIVDNGKGIPRDMSTLFQLGCRGPESFRSAEGAGVGLWLVRQLVELHGGTIDVESFADPTTLRIRLPHHLSSDSGRI